MSENAPVRYLPASFAELPDWKEGDVRAALHAFRLGCETTPAFVRPADTPFPLDDAELGDAFDRACRAARSANIADAASTRLFFEEHFTPFRVLGPDGADGLFTGYYDPEIPASRSKRAAYPEPIYGLPPEARAGAALPARAEIENGAVARGWPVLFWAKDPVDVFTLHIQGSGRITLAEGGYARVAYAGNNGRGYVAIGRVMKERGLLPADGVNMPAIQGWLRAHPAEARALMQENPRFIFFREVPDGGGTKGQLGVTLTPMATLAVDPAFIPLGLPLWLDTNAPADKTTPLRLLAVAQDRGGAIKGPVRGDIFFGSGPHAAQQAGHMAERGRYFLFVPKSQ